MIETKQLQPSEAPLDQLKAELDPLQSKAVQQIVDILKNANNTSAQDSNVTTLNRQEIFPEMK